MGISRTEFQTLLYAKSVGVNFGETLTLGRQSLFVSAYELQLINKQFGSPLPDDELARVAGYTYSDELIRLLGASSVEAMDTSHYEGAAIVHNMNLPTGAELDQKCDLIIDGGTLEHVFNYPQAISNCMRMLKPEGHYVGITCGDNHSGHGFYQFSPELYFSLFSETFGFRIVDVFLSNQDTLSQWYRVKDPRSLGRRVVFNSNRPVLIIAIAKKIRHIENLFAIPDQSDYQEKWNKAGQIESCVPKETRPPQPALSVLDKFHFFRRMYRKARKWRFSWNPEGGIDPVRIEKAVRS